MPSRPGGRRAGGLLGLPSFRLLFAATLASSVGTWLAYVALVVDVYDRTGSATWVSALLVTEFAPPIAVGLLLGPLLDRLRRRRLLVAADLARAAVFCVLPFASTPTQIVLLALAAGVATSVFRPVVYASVPNLVPEEGLPRANALLQASENVTVVLGPLAGGAVAAAAGPDPSYWANAASFAVSALLIAAIPARLERGAGAREGHWRELLAGLSLARVPAVRAVLVGWSLVMAAAGLVGVSEIVLAREVFDAGDAGYGLMLGAMGVGLVLGGLRAGGVYDRRGARATYAGAVCLIAAGIAAAAAAPGVWSAAALLIVAGAGNGGALVGNALLLQRSVPDELRGRAFTLAMSATFAALGVGTLVAGPLTGALGARAVWAVAAAVTLLGAAAAALILRGAPADRTLALRRES